MSYVATGYWVTGYAEGDSRVSPAGGVAGVGGRKKPRRVIFENEPLTEQEVVAVVKRAQRDTPKKLEPRLEKVADKVRAIKEPIYPTYKPMPLLEAWYLESLNRNAEGAAMLKAILDRRLEEMAARQRELDDDDEDVLLLI